MRVQYTLAKCGNCGKKGVYAHQCEFGQFLQCKYCKTRRMFCHSCYDNLGIVFTTLDESALLLTEKDVGVLA